MKKILSIVIPSYNVEKFLEQTLVSFIDETVMEDIEVLVVDDGSKDGTYKIGKKYQDKYPNTFRIISKENGGHGSAINVGIREAKGKYFKNVDGDDWVATDDFVKLVHYLKTCDSDCIITNYYEVEDDTLKKTAFTHNYMVPKKELNFKNSLSKQLICMHAIVFKTEILQKNGVKLDEHCFYVDVEYILYPVPYINTVTYLDLYVYMYRVALLTQSVSALGYQKHYREHQHVTLQLMEFMEKQLKNNIESEKEKYLLDRISNMVIDQIRIYMSFPLKDRHRYKKELIEFEESVKSNSIGVYDEVSRKKRTISFLRRNKYFCYTAMLIIFKLRKLIKGI